MNIEEYRNRIEKAHTFTGIPSYWDELQEMTNERDRLRAVVSEILPFMLNDVKQGLHLGEPPFETSHCDTKESLCPDCEWYEQSVSWQKRIDSGEFDQYE